MTQSLHFSDRSDIDKLVIRTHFSDEGAWWQVLSRIDDPWGGEFESTSYVVNDQSWKGTAVERIRQAAFVDPGLRVLFVADEETMLSADHTLLAVNLDKDPNYLDGEYDVEHGTKFGRQFRILPYEASGLHCNLTLGNMAYEEWADVAAQSDGGVFRGF